MKVDLQAVWFTAVLATEESVSNRANAEKRMKLNHRLCSSYCVFASDLATLFLDFSLMRDSYVLFTNGGYKKRS